VLCKCQVNNKYGHVQARVTVHPTEASKQGQASQGQIVAAAAAAAMISSEPSHTQEHKETAAETAATILD